MSRLLILLVVASVGGACELSQTSQRTIPYRSDRPIAERLLPGDKQVLVKMDLQPSTDAGPAEAFDAELQRLRRSDVIALVRVTTAQGEIADRGTWVRTRINAGIDRLVQAPAGRSLGQSIEFTYPAGTAQIGDVVVTTGKFPRFFQFDQYLVFLLTQPKGSSSLVWAGTAFRVDEQGVLQRVGVEGGGEQSFPTNLVGRNASEVMEALAR